jgi:hypothetical protein
MLFVASHQMAAYFSVMSDFLIDAGSTIKYALAGILIGITYALIVATFQVYLIERTDTGEARYEVCIDWVVTGVNDTDTDASYECSEHQQKYVSSGERFRDIFLHYALLAGALVGFAFGFYGYEEEWKKNDDKKRRRGRRKLLTLGKGGMLLLLFSATFWQMHSSNGNITSWLWLLFLIAGVVVLVTAALQLTSKDDEDDDGE